MHINQKGFVNIVLVILIVIFVAVIGYLALRKPSETIPTGPSPTTQVTPPTTTNNPTPIQQNVQTTTNPTSKIACQNLHNEIENDLSKANYCQNNSDCDVLNLGDNYIAFGCFHFVNKAVDKNKFYEKMRIYVQSCTLMIDECAPAPKPSCVANKCVYSE